MRVLALDPGARVGWASAEINSLLTFPDGTAVRECGLLPDQWIGLTDEGVWKHTLTTTGHGIAYMKDAATQACRAILANEYDVVVYEQWKLTAKGAKVLLGSEMEWCQFIGMIRKACWDSGTKQVKQPTSVVPVGRGSADRSLKCGHPSAADVARRIAAADAVSHDDGHDGSALRHLWWFFFSEYV